MTQIEFYMKEARDYLELAKQDYDRTYDNSAKKCLERVEGCIRLALELIGTDDGEANVCVYCGEESPDNHPGAFCVKG